MATLPAGGIKARAAPIACFKGHSTYSHAQRKFSIKACKSASLVFRQPS